MEQVGLGTRTHQLGEQVPFCPLQGEIFTNCEVVGLVVGVLAHPMVRVEVAETEADAIVYLGTIRDKLYVDKV